MKKIRILYIIGLCILSAYINASDACPKKIEYKLTEIHSNGIVKNSDPNVKIVTYEAESIEDTLSSLGYSTPAKRKEFYESIKKEIKKQNNTWEIKPEEVDDLDFWKKDYGGPEHFVIVNSKNETIFHIIATPYMFWERYYVIFSKSKNKWSIQKILYNFSKYDKKNLKLLEFKNKLFLSILGSEGGTGAYTSWYDIYVLNVENIHKVLSYPGDRRRNDRGGPNYQTDSKTSPLMIKFNNNDCYLEYTLTTKYFGFIPADHPKSEDEDNMQQVVLFTKKYNVCYNWNSINEELSRDELKSSLNEDPFNAVFVDQSLSEFLQYFDTDIKKISNNPTKKQKIWLNKSEK